MSIALMFFTLLFAVDAEAPVDADDTPPSSVADVPVSAPAAPSAPIAIAGVTTSEPVVALTFDACATRKQANGFDRKIFDILAKDEIPATF
jgi:peptidoglycan/xylan/chitin deacetylase (PgdA/CDA1 family)